MTMFEFQGSKYIKYKGDDGITRVYSMSDPNRPRVPEWVLVPTDLLSHISDWRTACEIAMKAAPEPTEDADDRSYWQHQLNVLDRIEQQMGK